jgi:chemotaxis protein methyltransferase CheR
MRRIFAGNGIDYPERADGRQAAAGRDTCDATDGVGKRTSVKDADCIDFLQWALPRLGLRWAGFRKVRRQVCKRISSRIESLGLANGSAYRAYLEGTPGEWAELDGLCRVTISRFYRDRSVFQVLEERVLPSLARSATAAGELTALRVWSAGCASGEEPYTLRILWDLELAPHFPDLDLAILATDADPAVLARAKAGRYARSSLKELPEQWRQAAFEPVAGGYCLKTAFHRGVRFGQTDIRTEMPDGSFHLILCRNLAFTYFDQPTQLRVGRALATRLAPGGVLVVGVHERLPETLPGLEPFPGAPGAYLRAGPFG